MRSALRFMLMLICLCVISPGIAQTVEKVKRDLKKKSKPKKLYPDFFGFQYRPIVPTTFFGTGPSSIVGENAVHNSIITQKFSFSAGGVMRIGFTNRLAIETGINFTRRNYRTDYFVPDSNLTASTDIRNISYDIPVNLLIYAKINEKFYINASFGNSFLLFPTNTAAETRTLPHNFITASYRARWIQFAINANTGMEFRTEKDGIYYLGASFLRPFAPIYRTQTAYKYINDSNVGSGKLNGIYFCVDLKYFLPIVKTKGAPTKPGLVD